MQDQEPFAFRLYVAGDTPNSLQARRHLTVLCESHLPGRHRVEIVDVFLEPEQALADGIFLTPMLVKLSPMPVQRIVGTLAQLEVVLQTLGLAQAVAP